MLLDTPAIPEPRNDLERALLSTVEISGEAGTGSGCLVSPTGLILTNYHVIRNNSGEPSRKLTVAVNLGFRVPPKELFRAEVIDYHEETDLALLRITGGFYEQELPEGYTFPFLELGDPQELAIGDQIGLVGFPGIGGSGSRASVTFTRGVISGYEQTDCGVVIKTDGQVSPGNSGGPAIDGDYTLIGLPTTIIEENAGLMGFIHPISLLPDEWISIIREAQ
jgi:S1-C subfamily serine protease